MDSLIYKTNNKPANNHYIIEPVCGSLKLKIRKSDIPDGNPKFSLNFLFESISAVISETQFVQLVRTAEWMAKHQMRERFRMYKPFGIKASQAPLAYWKFAIQGQLREYRKQKYPWTIRALNDRREKRLEYMKLWKQKILQKIDTPRLEEMENDLTVDDITYFRLLTEATIPVEQLYKKSSWWNSLNWWSSSNLPAEEIEDKYGLTPSQKKFFYQAIGYKENQDKAEVIDEDDPTDVILSIHLPKKFLSHIFPFQFLFP